MSDYSSDKQISLVNRLFLRVPGSNPGQSKLWRLAVLFSFDLQQFKEWSNENETWWNDMVQNCLKSDKKNSAHNPKLTVFKNSTICALSSWNLVKVITSWDYL